MQTTHHTHGNALNFTAKLINGLRSLFGGRNDESETLVANCTNDIRRVSGLAQWVESVAAFDESERRKMLLRAAGTFSGEFCATELANTLSCMATDAGLFLAVSEALKNSARETGEFAQAA